MAIKHTIERRWSGNNGTTLSQQVEVSVDAEDNRDLSIADSTTDQQVVMSIDVSALKSLYISSDQTVTIETNSGSTPDDTLTITANEPLVWTENDGHANPFASGTDVTALYVTNSSGSTAAIKIRVGQDSTP